MDVQVVTNVLLDHWHEGNLVGDEFEGDLSGEWSPNSKNYTSASW